MFSSSYLWFLIEKILDEEFAERQFAKLEMQINKTENSLKGLTVPQREWFQTMKQRKEEKERLSVNPNETTDKGKDKKSNKQPKKRGSGDHEFNKKNAKKRREERMSPEQLAKARAMREIEKVSLVRAKLMKSKSRPGKLNAVREDDDIPKSKVNNKRRSKFNLDLTDTSNRGSKKLRYVNVFEFTVFFSFIITPQPLQI